MMMKTKRHNLRGLAVLICSITLALHAMAQEATPAGPGRVKAPVIISDHGFNGVAAWLTKPLRLMSAQSFTRTLAIPK
jgi:hypothetical protein